MCGCRDTIEAVGKSAYSAMSTRYHPSPRNLMDIMELGAIGEMVGGVAVIASLIYIGLQVRQSIGKPPSGTRSRRTNCRVSLRETPSRPFSLSLTLP